MSNKELSEELLFTLANELDNRHDWTFDGTKVRGAIVEAPYKMHVFMKDGRTITFIASQETPYHV